MRAVRALVLIVAMALASLVVIAPTAAANPGFESDFINRVNGARSASGRSALVTNGELTEVARRWSQRMANDQRLSHNPNLAREVTQDWEKLAENVGFGGDVASIHEAFMNSPSHRANIVDPALTHIGVGVVVDGAGQIWVTEVFMRLRGGGSPPPTTAPPPPPPTTAAPAPAPAPSPPPTAPRAPRPVATTAPPAAESPPVTEAPEAAPAEATPAASSPAVSGPTRRLVLVLDGLAALDDRH